MVSKELGFTLIEILVVVVIIGVLLGITLLSPITGSVHHQVQKEANHLQALFAQARDKALIENRVFGFSIDEQHTYRWWQLPAESQQWQALEQPPFQSRRLPDGLAVTLEPLEDGRLSEQDDLVPTVVFLTDYQVTPFRLHILADQKQSLYLTTDGLSDIERVRE